ncbi:copper resistance protein NlpE [Luteimonas aestuarii]|nr:copper resistance protein NlpE [Luteimonas aestuarii]
MSLRSLPLSLTLALAICACQPAADKSTDIDTGGAATANATTTTPEAQPGRDPLLEGSDAIAIEHHSRPEPAGFDRRAFAGMFSGTLPCADCPGIDTRLHIADDGTFHLTEAYRDRGNAQTAGTWTVDAAGTRLLLDPDVKDAPDRHLSIVSNDELRALDPEGNAIDSTLDHLLRRD